MKFLLTSAGIRNTSIHNALLDLLGKPIAESSALCIPTAAHGHPNEDMPDNSLVNAESWAAGMSVPAYAIDDETAIKVIDGAVEVVSKGHWKLFTP